MRDIEKLVIHCPCGIVRPAYRGLKRSDKCPACRQVRPLSGPQRRMLEGIINAMRIKVRQVASTRNIDPALADNFADDASARFIRRFSWLVKVKPITYLTSCVTLAALRWIQDNAKGGRSICRQISGDGDGKSSIEKWQSVEAAESRMGKVIEAREQYAEIAHCLTPEEMQTLTDYSNGELKLTKEIEALCAKARMIVIRQSLGLKTGEAKKRTGSVAQDAGAGLFEDITEQGNKRNVC